MLSPLPCCHQLDDVFLKNSELELDVIGTVVDFKPNATNINLLGTFPQETALKMASEYLAGLVTYLPEPNSVNAMPNKIFEYMSIGLPVICSDFPHWIKIVESAGCGIAVDPTSSKKIGEALHWIQNHESDRRKMGLRGRETVLNQFSWSTEEEKLLRLYENI